MPQQDRPVTLHLLESLDWLLAECNVSRAAVRAGISQSTMSNNLAALRQIFGDPLLVRQGPRLVPTPRALEVVGPIRESLLRIAEAVEGQTEFRPGRTRRQFSIITVDFVQVLMMQPLVERWAELSSKLELVVLPITLDTLSEQLASGQADVAITSPRFVPASLRHAPLFSDRFVVLARRDHPVLGRKPNLKQYLSCTHIQVSPMGRRLPSQVDEALQRAGQERHVRVCVPQYLMAAELAASTHLVVTVPASVASRAVQRYPVVMHEVPFEMDPLRLVLAWHERSHQDAAHRWLREELKAVAAGIAAGP
ncbi:MAG TPA: LysR family transcriptional regulator [Ramlibacter sp.]|nr:LysR family transcriptional regulator [Ramlibacter sp.]